jgi:hypothetical protein
MPGMHEETPLSKVSCRPIEMATHCSGWVRYGPRILAAQKTSNIPDLPLDRICGGTPRIPRLEWKPFTPTGVKERQPCQS